RRLDRRGARAAGSADAPPPPEEAAAACRGRAAVGAGDGDPQPRALAGGEPAAGADPDGDRRGEDVRGGERRLPAGQVRRRPARALPRRSREPRPADAEGVPGLHRPGREPQVHRALQRPAPVLERGRPGGAGDDHDHSAALLDPEGRGGARTRARRALQLRPHAGRAGAGRVQPAPSDRDLRRRHRRRVPPLDLRRLAAGARVLRRLRRRPDRHAEQAGLRLLQPEPRHGVHARGGGRRPGERRLRRLPDPHADQRAGLDDRRRPRHRLPRPADAPAALEDEVAYDADALDRRVVAKDQIRTVVRTFKERLFTEIFPGRSEVPKTLIFAKDDSHADDIVQIVREEFGKGDDFAVKITYRSTGRKPDEMIAEFRNSYNPRIAVTVDMIATGTDVRPLECVFFMRAVKSRTYFEQMKGRGVRVIDEADFRSVTPDARAKDRFVIVDAVGVTELDLSDTQPLDRQPTVPLEKLLKQLAFGSRDPDLVSTVAGRIARLDRQLTKADREELEELAGMPLRDLTHALVAAVEAATERPDEAKDVLDAAVEPLATNPTLLERLVDVRRSYEQTLDEFSQDKVIAAGYSLDGAERARQTADSFRRFIDEHKDEITALQILYSRPYRERLTFTEIKELAQAIGRPPYQWTPEKLWQAYEALERSKVRGSGGRVLTDLVSLVRFALEQEDELVPYPELVGERFRAWLLQQENAGRTFTPAQLAWLERIRDHVAASLAISPDDFDYTPFVEQGGIGKAYELFGDELTPLLDELNEVLVA